MQSVLGKKEYCSIL